MSTAVSPPSTRTPSAAPSPYSVGLGPLLDAVCERSGGVLDGPRARRVRRLIGDRYTITVTDAGIETRGVVRRHRVRWDKVDHVEFEPLTEIAARRVIGRMFSRTATRVVPIPGLRWLAQQVVSTVVDPAASAAADLAGKVATEGPSVFVAARRSDGEGVDLDGALALTSLLSPQLSTIIREHATMRDVPIRS